MSKQLSDLECAAQAFEEEAKPGVTLSSALVAAILRTIDSGLHPMTSFDAEPPASFNPELESFPPYPWTVQREGDGYRAVNIKTGARGCLREEGESGYALALNDVVFFHNNERV